VRSLRGRLFLAVALAVIGSLALSLAVGALLVRRQVQNAALAGLGRQAGLLALREQNQPITTGEARALGRFLATQGERFVVADRPLGPLVAKTLPPDVVSAVNGGRSFDGRVPFLGRDVLASVRPAGPSHSVVLSRPAGLVGSDWTPYLGSFLVAGAVGIAVAGVASYVLARGIARPVARVAEASRELAVGRPPGLLPVEGAQEVATLARSFNEMAGRLERARETERRFLLSVSHELKTPLTAVRGYAEALQEGAVQPVEGAGVIAREAERLERLVQDLLDLARLDLARQEGGVTHAFTVRREPIDLAGVVRDAVGRHERQARAFGVTLEGRAADPAPAVGDTGRTLQVVSNLVENALRCTPAGGRVVVSARPSQVSVADTGPGIAAQDVERAFERFYLHGKYSAERPVGSGLGLAVVKELTEAMGGAVSVHSEPGTGSTFTVSLPDA
jgi:two-component system sensor histidine kinase BaeS